MPTTEERIEALRAELEATDDGGRSAVIQYEIGHVTQHELEDEAQAVREYLQAYNHDPQFRPPLLALVTLFERRRSAKNLARLYDAEARSATNPREAASALADRAVLLLGQEAQNKEAQGEEAQGGEAQGGEAQAEKGEAQALLEQAFDHAAEAADIALLLEHELLSRGQTEAALLIIEARSDLVRDPVLATLLRLEIARAREAAGDVDGAIEALRTALATPAARWRVLEEVERVARAADRPMELATTLLALAKITAASAQGEDDGALSGAFSVKRFQDEVRTTARAAALYREAARLKTNQLDDAEGARQAYDEALLLHPGDALLRYERMLACELSGDVDAAAEEAARFLEAGAEGALAASLHFRLAEHHQGRGETEPAIASLRAGLEADPSSAVIAAMLDDIVRATGDVRSAHESLLEEAGRAEGEAKAEAFFEAANLATYRLADPAAARLGHTAAAEASEKPAPILREGLLAAMRLGDADGAKYFAHALLECELDDPERSAVLRDAHELARLVLEDDKAAHATLRKALESPAARAWAPDLARIGAAEEGDLELLAKAHLALAERSVDDETTAAHLCAAARAQARASDDDGAVTSLKAALEKSPNHPYVMALLEEVYRARGDAEEVVRLLRRAAEQSDAPRAAETRLLLAGAAAEAADDFDKAIQTYEEAAERSPFSLAPVLALRRLAEGQKDTALLLRALEALSQREIAAGDAGRHTVALGEHYDLISGKSELAEEPLRAALSGSLALTAAVDLALVPIEGGDATRLAGLERLLEHAGDEAKPGMLREAAGTAFAVGDYDKVRSLLEQLREIAPTDRWASLGALRLSALVPEDRQARADAWTSLGRATDDPVAAAELVNHGLRTQVFGQGEDAIDDAVIIAHEILSMAPESLHSAIALDESLSAGDDPEGRAEALGTWLEQAGDAGHSSLTLARGRALAAAGRSQEALEVLLRIAVADADDLASWEAIRVCARDCQAWGPLVEACDRMAHLVDDDELTMLLTEESAAVLMDEMQQDGRAERRLRRVLAIDATRPIAYGRLHDFLAERADDRGLLGLVSARIDLVDGVEELAKLYYEQARLHRSLNMQEEALTALDNLLMLEEDHVGGLALLVELQVHGENWGGAVEALRSLAAAADVPDGQRRIARLGAADFLNVKLNDPEGALGELLALHEAQLADLEIYERAAALAERIGNHDAAAEALEQAVSHAATAAMATQLGRRAGAIHAEARLDKPAAIGAYRRAIAASPTDLECGEALARLLEGDELEQLSRLFEHNIRGALHAHPLDAALLRSLGRAAAWRGDAGLQNAVLGVLVATRLASEEEASAWGAAPPVSTPRGTLDEAGFAALQTAGLHTPAFRLAAAIAEAASEMDGLDPAGFGLGRGDLQKADSPLRTELRAIGGMFGLPPSELYTGGSEAQRLDIAPLYKGKLNWVTGSAITPPLSPDQRFTVGWLSMGARLGVTPFVRRGPMGAAIALFAAADAAEVPLPAGQGRASMADTKRRIYKAMPRRVRKSLPEMVRELGDGQSIDAWSQELGRTAQRAGLLASNDPTTAIRRVLGAEPNADLVYASPDAMDLIFFWLSPECTSLRERLGLVS